MVSGERVKVCHVVNIIGQSWRLKGPVTLDRTDKRTSPDNASGDVRQRWFWYSVVARQIRFMFGEARYVRHRLVLSRICPEWVRYSSALDPVDLRWRCPVMSVSQ